MGNYRFVICIDINANDLDQAYAQLRKAMDSAEKHNGESWEGFETTDEAYAPDGEPIHPYVLADMRYED